MKLLLSFDQATSVAGFAIHRDGKLEKHGKAKFEGTTIERIAQVKQWADAMADMLNTSDVEFEIGIEDIQLQQDVTTFKTLAWLQGVLLVLFYEKGIKATTCFSTEWKSTCGVKGKTRPEQKRNAQKYVFDTYGIKATQDECDAICIGDHLSAQADKVVNWE